LCGRQPRTSYCNATAGPRLLLNAEWGLESGCLWVANGSEWGLQMGWLQCHVQTDGSVFGASQVSLCVQCECVCACVCGNLCTGVQRIAGKKRGAGWRTRRTRALQRKRCAVQPRVRLQPPGPVRAMCLFRVYVIHLSRVCRGVVRVMINGVSHTIYVYRDVVKLRRLDAPIYGTSISL
jgi:hypothetical protein